MDKQIKQISSFLFNKFLGFYGVFVSCILLFSFLLLLNIKSIQKVEFFACIGLFSVIILVLSIAYLRHLPWSHPIVLVPIIYTASFTMGGLVGVDILLRGRIIPVQERLYSSFLYYTAIAFFIIGGSMGSTNSKIKRKRRLRLFHIIKLKRPAILVLLFFMAGLGAVAMLTMYGSPLFSENILFARYKERALKILPFTASLLIPVAYISLIKTYVSQSVRQKILFSLLSILAVVLYTLVGGGRIWIVIVIIAFVLWKQSAKLDRASTIIILIIAAGVLFSIFGYIRDISKITTSDPVIESIIGRFHLSREFQWFTSIAITFRIIYEVFILSVHHASQQGFLFGYMTFGSVFTALPGKQLLPGYYFTEYVLESKVSQTGATAVSLLSGFYLDGGIIFLLLGSLLLGAIICKFYESFRKTSSLSIVLIYPLCMSMVLIGGYGNSLFSLSLILWVLFLFIYSKIKLRLII